MSDTTSFADCPPNLPTHQAFRAACRRSQKQCRDEDFPGPPLALVEGVFRSMR